MKIIRLINDQIIYNLGQVERKKNYKTVCEKYTIIEAASLSLFLLGQLQRYHVQMQSCASLLATDFEFY